MISGEHIIEFTYSESLQEYTDILNTHLVSLESKHIANVDSSKTKNILDTAKMIDYKRCIFGSHRINPSISGEKDIITSMQENTNFNRPVRIVIDQNNGVWSDNTHSTIAYCLRYGYNSKIKDIPFYVIDLREKTYKIISSNRSVIVELDKIKSAIGSAERIKKYVNGGYRSESIPSWKIKDLMDQLNYFKK